MANSSERKSQTRLIIAGGLFLTSIAASFLFSYISHTGSHYWVVTRALPQGVQITRGDIQSISATLSPGIDGYLLSNSNPVGSITSTNLYAGQLLSARNLTDDSSQLTSESLSLSVRNTDIPNSTHVGDLVTLYQVHDAQNGEAPIAPARVISGVFVRNIARKSANFGSDVALTISVARDDVATVLAATSSGRIAVVESNG